jgi:hypothetical protein
MSKYIITNTERYEVEADSPEQALVLYKIVIDGIEPTMFDLPNGLYDTDQFEYLDGKTEAVEKDSV